MGGIITKLHGGLGVIYDLMQYFFKPDKIKSNTAEPRTQKTHFILLGAFLMGGNYFSCAFFFDIERTVQSFLG